ncbi:MAG: AAA family ATPase [Dysgonomonas sp.]
MILSALKYTRYAGAPREWSVVGKDDDYVYFTNINLLVGKNASGKSRTLNIIRKIAGLLSGRADLSETTSPTEYFELIFTDEDKQYKYILDYKDRVVVNEILYQDNKIYLDRNKNVLLNTQGESIIVDTDTSELLISKQDLNGQPYFKDFVAWGDSLRNYLFANQLEKNRLVKDYTQASEGDQDIDDPNMLVYTFYRGKHFFGEEYVAEISSNMQELGYYISDICIQEKNGKYGLFVEEEGEYMVSQREMSQGMFRALSLLIMLTYARLSGLSLCLLIDDMGEGLDFDRSKKMMDIVIKKVNNSDMQFFMTSNDRTIMNRIPLRYWSVIDRDRNKSIFYDYKNSKDTFEDFKYTGLNNFDFLATNFYRKGFGIMDDDNDND